MPATMSYSLKGQELTEQFEASGHPNLTAYWDSLGKVWTIGYGHTGSEVHEGLTWTKEQCESALQSDIHWASNACNSLVHISLTQGEFDAITDFIYNVGVGNFAHSTMLKLLNAHCLAEAANEFEKWDRAKGVVIAGLLRRRWAEKEEFLEDTVKS